MTASSAFTIVTPENLHLLSRFVLSRTGYFLQIDTAINWDFSINLFRRPTLRLNRGSGGPSISPKHRGSNATNPLDDREYRFGKHRDRKGLHVRDRVAVGENHWLEIGPLWGGHYGFCFATNHLNIYVPNQEGLREALAYIFRNPLVPIDTPLSSDIIDHIISVILEELETKRAVRQAVADGVAADRAFGLA